MGDVLGWIGQIFEWILSIFPRIVIVRSTSRAVCFSRGKYPILWKPGLHWYIPLISEYEEHEVVRQTKTLPKQLLTTTDGVIIGINGLVIYTISDILTLFTETSDWSDVIRDHSIEIISNIISNSSSEKLRTQYFELKEEILTELKADLKEYGVEIKRVSFTNFVFLNFCFGTWDIDGDLAPSYEFVQQA